MKKFFAVALLGPACVSFVGCGEPKPKVEPKKDPPKVETPAEEKPMGETPVNPEEKPALLTAANDHFAAVLCQPLDVDALTVFAETRFDLTFVAEERFLLRPVDNMKVAS